MNGPSRPPDHRRDHRRPGPHDVDRVAARCEDRPAMAYELGIIGAGNMAEAIVRGVLRAGSYRPEQVIASDVSPARREVFASICVKAVETNEEVARQSRVIILSVKPQQMEAVLGTLKPVLDLSTLVI